MRMTRQHLRRPATNYSLRGSLLSGLGQDDSGDEIDVDTGLSDIDSTAPGGAYALPTSDYISTPMSTPSTSSLATDLTAAAGASSSVAKAINSTQSPYVVAGTSLVYNPATGTFSSTGAVSTAEAGAISSLTGMLPLIGLVLVAGFLLSSIGGKK
jgi:hypothetical protein